MHIKILVCDNTEGQTEETIKQARDSIMEIIQKQYEDETEPVTIIFNTIPGQKGALSALAKSLDKMADADAIYFADGYSKCRIGMVEYLTARLYNKNIIRE